MISTKHGRTTKVALSFGRVDDQRTKISITVNLNEWNDQNKYYFRSDLNNAIFPFLILVLHSTPLKSFTKYMRCYLEKYTIWLICMYLDSYCITVRSQCISLSEIILHLNPVRLSLKNPMGSIPEYWLVAVVVTARSTSTPFLDDKKSASSFY